jgi:hypothetical protein
MLINNKKSQHEIAGFVLIVVIVSIIGVIFLALTLGRASNEAQPSVEISNLLSASMYYTTDCAVNYVPQYKEGQDLIKECHRDQMGDYINCLDGRGVCQALESTMREILDESLRIAPDAQNKAYRLNIYFDPLSESDPQSEILYMEGGVFSNCSAIPGGRHLIAISAFMSGTIHVELEICKG